MLQAAANQTLVPVNIIRVFILNDFSLEFPAAIITPSPHAAKERVGIIYLNVSIIVYLPPICTEPLFHSIRIN